MRWSKLVQIQINGVGGVRMGLKLLAGISVGMLTFAITWH
jgi:hypothetical protein